jgi:hypothetical protein
LCSFALSVIWLYGCCAMNNKEQQLNWIIILIGEVGQVHELNYLTRGTPL